MQIKNLMVRGIFDSRGRETLELGLTNAQDQECWAQVSSGESAGSREAVCLKLADFVLTNNGSVAELYAQVDETMAKLGLSKT